MSKLKDNSIHFIMTDLPYGTTKNSFDVQIDLTKLWFEYRRLIKRNGCIALFAQCPFDKVLGVSNYEMLKYEWIWEKNTPTGHLNSHFAPMKSHENILIFSKAAACYVKDKSQAMVYYPQRTPAPKRIINTSRKNSRSTNYDTKWQRPTLYDNEGLKYPTSVLKFDTERGLHPTQKPVCLLEYMINTYTQEGETVLDSCAGSGTTAIAAMNTKRNFICIERDDKYFEIMKKRVEQHQPTCQ